MPTGWVATIALVVVSIATIVFVAINVTHIRLSRNARSYGVDPVVTVAVTALVAGLIRDTVPSKRLTTHIALPSDVRLYGPLPTMIVAVTATVANHVGIVEQLQIRQPAGKHRVGIVYRHRHQGLFAKVVAMRRLADIGPDRLWEGPFIQVFIAGIALVGGMLAQGKKDVQRVAIDSYDRNAIPDRKAVGGGVRLDHPAALLCG